MHFAKQDAAPWCGTAIHTWCGHYIRIYQCKPFALPHRERERARCGRALTAPQDPQKSCHEPQLFAPAFSPTSTPVSRHKDTRPDPTQTNKRFTHDASRKYNFARTPQQASLLTLLLSVVVDKRLWVVRCLFLHLASSSSWQPSCARHRVVAL